MAGYVSTYFIENSDGVDGYDGIRKIDLVIAVGASDREWLSPLKFRTKAIEKPLWKIDTIIPNPKQYYNCIIDAVIAFAPQFFSKCPLVYEVAKEIGKNNRIDFNEKSQIPKSWDLLRAQATPIFEKLSIYEARLSSIRGQLRYPKWE